MTSGLPRLGFLGVGWIGMARLRSLVAAGAAHAVAVSDADADVARAAAGEVGAVNLAPDELLAHAGLDAVVIATPSALHADQSIAAFRAGHAVFCQKPLARTTSETRAVVDAARTAGRLLGVDLSYRHLRASRRMREVVAAGEVGDVYAAELTFHNAYGPDKPWFTDGRLSGGGCVIDLGTHLVDLAGWILGALDVERVTSRLFRHGMAFDQRLDDGDGLGVDVEDAAFVTMDLASGTVVRLGCSWFLHAGAPAEISATFYGTRGAVRLCNVDGSFYDFDAWLMRGTERCALSAPPDDWGGRAAVSWAHQLATSPGYDAAAERLLDLATVIDRIYAR
ncbi:MAG: putative dehydrogenase [Ilumatobacteraceae bacterium]|nr:putative dehydrogenase [Ilumatobacteraceae bacterium]